MASGKLNSCTQWEDEGVAMDRSGISACDLMSSEYNIPVALMDRRHIEKIVGTNKPSGTWRMKERVCH